MPWAFVYRQPVQTMMSHLDPRKGKVTRAVCLRSKRNPSKIILDELAEHVGPNAPKQKIPVEAHCAAHLNYLCEDALTAYSKYGTRVDKDKKVVQRALFLNYDALPGVFTKVLLPLFLGQQTQGHVHLHFYTYSHSHVKSLSH